MNRAPFIALALACSLPACSGQRPPPAPARFDRPNRVDFACVESGKAVPLRKCKDDNDPKNSRALHALVTQSARGEVAAVNLESRTVLDSRRDIPGYTFVPVGELPSGIVVPRERPQLTYVADYGSRDIRVLDTTALVTPLTGRAELRAAVQVVRLQVLADDGVTQVAAAPTDMLLAPDENALLVTVPDLGRLLWLPLQRCDGTQQDCHEGWIDESGIASVRLSGSLDRQIASMLDAQPRASYELLCGYSRPDPPPPTPVSVPDSASMTPPRPSGMAIDAYCSSTDTYCQRRLLLADEALPLIHVVDLDAIVPGSNGGDALLPPIVVGVPTREVAVTPKVPVTLDSTDLTQYVYAIDATDGSLLVAENGQLLNVSSDPGTRPDRITLAGTSVAVKLAVLTPTYQVGSPGPQYIRPSSAKAAPSDDLCIDTDHTAEDPARLRGVFIAAAMTDGTVRIIDVYDREAEPAPGGDTACRACSSAHIPAIVRHHARLAHNFVPEAGAMQPTLAPVPTIIAFRATGINFPVRTDGTSGSPDAPGLDCMPCDPDLLQIYPQEAQLADQAQQQGVDDAGVDNGPSSCPSDTPALLCAVADPWAASNDEWFATYEGQIPGTLGGGGRIVGQDDPENHSGAPELLAPVDFCKAGVLGNDDIGLVYKDQPCEGASASGDQLVVTSRILGDAARMKLDKRVEPLCTAAAKALESNPTFVLAFEIRAAFRDHLVIEPTLVPQAQSIGSLKRFEDVLRCVGDVPIRFDVRTRGAFVVQGLQTGFQHRVKADANGRCVVDRDADPLLRGRARPGCVFRNRTQAFRPRKPDQRPTPAGMELLFQSQTPATKLTCNVTTTAFSSLTVVPVQLRYNDIDRRLYLVDIQDRGLVPIALTPFPATVDSAGTFN